MSTVVDRPVGGYQRDALSDPDSVHMWITSVDILLSMTPGGDVPGGRTSRGVIAQRPLRGTRSDQGPATGRGQSGTEQSPQCRRSGMQCPSPDPGRRKPCTTVSRASGYCFT